MSGKVCAFHKCTNSKRKNPELVFFSFPCSFNLKNDSRIATWAKNAGLSDSLTPDFYRNQLVCQLHFENWCFTNSLRKRLVHNAIPTIATDAIKAKDNKQSLIDESKFSENTGVENEALPQTSYHNAENTYEMHIGSQINKPTDQFLKFHANKLHIMADNNLFVNEKYNTCNYKTKPTNHKTYSRVKSTNCTNANVAETHVVDDVETVGPIYTCPVILKEKPIFLNVSTDALQCEGIGVQAHLSPDISSSSTKETELEDARIHRNITIKKTEKYNNFAPSSSLGNSSIQKQSLKDELECHSIYKLKKCNFNQYKKYDSVEEDLYYSPTQIIGDINEDRSNSEHISNFVRNLALPQKDNVLSDQENNINDLKRKLNYYRRQSMMKSSVINKLKKALSKSRKNNISNLIDKANVPNVCKIMAKMQINRNLSWNLNEQTLALKLYTKFPVTTKYMRDILGLRFPDEELLCAWIENKSVIKYKSV